MEKDDFLRGMEQSFVWRDPVVPSWWFRRKDWTPGPNCWYVLKDGDVWGRFRQRNDAIDAARANGLTLCYGKEWLARRLASLKRRMKRKRFVLNSTAQKWSRK